MRPSAAEAASHLRGREAVVRVLLQQRADARVRVVARHHEEGQPHLAPEPRGEQLLQREHVRGVHLACTHAR